MAAWLQRLRRAAPARPGRRRYLGILLDQPLAEVAPEPGAVLVVAPAALLAEEIPQPDGQVLYDLLTGHPDRTSRELVFLADLTAELRAWPQQTWTTVGISPEATLPAVVDRWRAGQVKGLELGGLSAEEARALARPAITHLREQLRAGPLPDQPPVHALAAPDQPPPRPPPPRGVRSCRATMQPLRA